MRADGAAAVSSGRRRGSIVDEVEPRIRELLAECPTMPATVIAERIGWDRGMTVLKDRVRELRPVYLPPDPASRTEYVAGEVAQCDFWFPDIELPVGFGQTRHGEAAAGVDDGVGYSRWLSARADPDPRQPRTCWPAGGSCIAGWARCRGVLVWDGEGAVGRWRRGVERAHRRMPGVPRHAGHEGVICGRPTRRPRGWSSGPTAIWRRRSCPAADVHRSPDDFNTQLPAGWRWRTHAARRALGCAPADRIAADRAAMLALPPVAPAVGWRASLRLPRDHYVRLDGNDYSVHPAVIGRRVEVDRRPGPGPGVLRRADRRRPRPGAGPDIRRSPTRAHRQAAKQLRHGRIGRWPPPAADPRSSSGAWATTTPSSASTDRTVPAWMAADGTVA